MTSAKTQTSPKTRSTDRVGSFRNIAVIRMSSVGDVIMALPALEGLRETYPNARISWIVERRARNVLDGHPALDEVIEFPREVWRDIRRRRFGLLRCLPHAWRFYRGLRKRRFDLTIDFQGNLKSATCTIGCGAAVRLGYSKAECKEPNHYFTNRHLDLGGQHIHRMERDLLMVGEVGVPFQHRPPRIGYDADDRRAGDATIPFPDGEPPVVILHPGTSAWMPNKRWPLASFASLGDTLAREAQARVLLSWGPGERPLCDEIRELMEQPSELLPDTPTIKSLGYLLSRADLVVGGDTGPLHLAYVQGVPTIGILGPSDPRFYYPLGHPERVFYRRMPCSPCRHRTCDQITCLTDI
ncbi:MAG: hypothetical protein CMJ83_06785, partial [Planctomycetes bacterium]|nr:hypothetical protein [Planctomycetota bacterium]